MLTIVFLATILMEILSAGGVLYSVFAPDRRIWPPQKPRSWQSILMNVLFLGSAAGVVALGLLDWSGASLAPVIRFALGGFLWLAGLALSIWSIASLGPAASVGDESALFQNGPYRYTRNPQYLGFIVALWGWSLVSASFLTLIAAIVGAFTLWLVPWAEEPWLSTKYCGEYSVYRRGVPRWLVWRRQ